MTDIEITKLGELRKEAHASAKRAQVEEDRLREVFNREKVFSREFSWLKIRTEWSNTRPNADPIRYTGDGAYGLQSALAMAAHDLAWPRLDPHAKALKVEIYFDPTRKGDLWKAEDREKMTLIATIEPPKDA